MPPIPPIDHRFNPGATVVSTTRTPATLHIKGITNNMYDTDHGIKSISVVDKNYENQNLSGGKRKSHRSRKRHKSKKSKSRKNRRKTSIRRKKSSFRR
jgi:hypothetical protein